MTSMLLTPAAYAVSGTADCFRRLTSATCATGTQREQLRLSTKCCDRLRHTFARIRGRAGAPRGSALSRLRAPLWATGPRAPVSRLLLSAGVPGLAVEGNQRVGPAGWLVSRPRADFPDQAVRGPQQPWQLPAGGPGPNGGGRARCGYHQALETRPLLKCAPGA